MLSNNSIKLNNWLKKISLFDKLNIDDAKELYKKALNTNDNTLKKRIS